MFWDRAAEAQRVLRELAAEKGVGDRGRSGAGPARRDLAVLAAELAQEEGDEAAERWRPRQGLTTLEQDLRALEVRSLFRDEADARAAILTPVKLPGRAADSQDWAEMLFRHAPALGGPQGLRDRHREPAAG